MKAILITFSVLTLALVVLLSRAFDSVQAASKADVQQQETTIAALTK